MRARRCHWIAIEERGAVERREEPLVRIDHERVGSLDAGEPCGELGHAEGGAAVGGVDVEPHVAAGAHVRHAGEVVDDATVGGTGAGHHSADPLVTGNDRIELVPDETVAFVAGNLDHLEIEQRRSVAHRRVG